MRAIIMNDPSSISKYPALTPCQRAAKLRLGCPPTPNARCPYIASEARAAHGVMDLTWRANIAGQPPNSYSTRKNIPILNEDARMRQDHVGEACGRIWMDCHAYTEGWGSLRLMRLRRVLWGLICRRGRRSSESWGGTRSLRKVVGSCWARRGQRGA